MGRARSNACYAIYRGDKFIDLGTLDYLAKKYHKRRDTLRNLAAPSIHKRRLNYGSSTLLYKIEDNKND